MDPKDRERELLNKEEKQLMEPVLIPYFNELLRGNKLDIHRLGGKDKMNKLLKAMRKEKIDDSEDEKEVV